MPHGNPEVTAMDAERLRTCLARPGSSVHMLGIGGVGMAGLALLLKQRGHAVSGCDAAAGPLTDWLRGQGIEVAIGHDPAHWRTTPDWIVRSPAVSREELELREAAARGIPVWDRGRVLPCVLAPYRTAAVAGTHGKTTTASLLAWMLRVAGRPLSYCIGGVCPGLGAVAHAEPSGDMVIEADESDGTLREYRVAVAVVTSMDLDHVDYFQDDARQREVFRRFMDQAGMVVYGADDPLTRELAGRAACGRSFGVENPAAVRASKVVLEASSSSFELELDGRGMGKVSLSVPGRHNVLNALAAVAVASAWDVPVAKIAEALASFRLPLRRFEQVAAGSGITVISDYAHHPAEIDALLAQARLRGPRRVLAVFQPHRFSRTRAFKPAFVRSLSSLDYLVLAPVYAASEPFVEGGTSRDLYEAFPVGSRDAVELTGSLEEAWSRLREHARAGDLVLVIGAGDVEKIGDWAREAWTGNLEPLP
ncbi:MAG TPA: UDP-N-acetylmuramate--L-alanine ligase [Kiritimatiellia bacterium]|nr:UDP-N-acetylmuramate--L-alanine ligase [Kiritimatiellia bacterium]